MIGLLAVRDLDGPLLRGDVFTTLAIHQVLLDDHQLMSAVLADAVRELVEHPQADVTPARPACVYVFTPDQLDATFARHVNAAFREEPLPPNLGMIVAVWRAPR